jgi:hypothetical protein
METKKMERHLRPLRPHELIGFYLRKDRSFDELLPRVFQPCSIFLKAENLFNQGTKGLSIHRLIA